MFPRKKSRLLSEPEPYRVADYPDGENMWEFLCQLCGGKNGPVVPPTVPVPGQDSVLASAGAAAIPPIAGETKDAAKKQ